MLVANIRGMWIMKSNKTSLNSTSRRSFLKKASYVAPAILTLPALPSFASSGSGALNGPIEDITDIKPNYDQKYVDKARIVTRSDVKAVMEKKKKDKAKELPQGLQMKLDKGKSLPPGWQKKSV